MVKLHIHRERSIESLLKEHTGIILKVCAMYVPYGRSHSEEWREEVKLTAISDGHYTLDLAGRPQAIYLLTLFTADGQQHTIRLIKRNKQ